MIKKFKFLYPLLFFFLITLGFFLPTFTKGLLPIPADTVIGLYHPFRDLYAKDYPNGIPYKNFLITDPVRQQYPWRMLAIAQEKMGQLPLWNPYNFAGTPLLANMQSAALYPLNIVFFVLPFHYAWTLLVILQPLLGGYFLYLYLRHWKLHPLACILGSIAFAFSGFSIAWLEWNVMGQVVMWLPLILLAKEKLLQKMSWKWIFVLIMAECMTFFAGHLQLLFYTLCISNVYLVVRILQLVQEKGNHHLIKNTIKIYLPFLLIGLGVFAITAIQWIPTLQFIGLSARDVDMADWHKAGWFVPWEHLIQFVAPDFFGNPTTLNYWGTWNYAELVGYIGIVPLVFALYAMFFRRDKKTLFFGLLGVIALLFALPTPLAALPYQFHLPLLSTSQPTRLLYVVDLSFAILSALGMDWYLRHKKKVFIPVMLIGFVFVLLWIYILSLGKNTLVIENLLTAKRNLFLPSLLFGITALLLVTHNFVKGTYAKYVAMLFIAITVFDLFRFGQKFTPFTNQAYLFPSTKVISFLQQHAGNYRVMAIDNRILPPNFSIMYKIQTVDGYDPLYLRRYGELIAAAERSEPNIEPPFGFNRIITPQRYGSHIMDLLGVKYMLSLTDITSPKFKKIFQEGETRVYENEGARPRAFFVGNVTIAENKQQAMGMMFSAIWDMSDEAIVEYEITNTKPLAAAWHSGKVKNIVLRENNVTIQTVNDGDGFLVLTDSYYPTWHARVDGKETQIYRTDYQFRGVVVPAGKHTVEFYNKLF